MSLHIVRSFSRPLPLISVALLIHAGSAVAADSGGEVRQQMRELLAGSIANHSAQRSQRRDEVTVRHTADAQEGARRLLLGVADKRVDGTQVMTRSESAERVSALRKDPLAPDEVRALARRFLGSRATGG